MHPELIDSHCHLAGAEFAEDLPAVVDRARAAGLTRALVILAAGDDAEGARARRLQELWPEVAFSVGIHPHHAGRYEGDVDGGLGALERALEEYGAVAVGEIGLDYHYAFSPREVQQEIFRRQLRLARDRRLPVVLHTREAEDDTFSILHDEAAGLQVVFHCFTGTPAMARQALALGGYLSFSGIVTFPRAIELREAARLVPADRLLVETDSPYLAPVPFRGKRNEPAYVARVVRVLAEVRGEHHDELVERIRANFEELCGKPPEVR